MAIKVNNGRPAVRTVKPVVKPAVKAVKPVVIVPEVKATKPVVIESKPVTMAATFQPRPEVKAVIVPEVKVTKPVVIESKPVTMTPGPFAVHTNNVSEGENMANGERAQARQERKAEKDRQKTERVKARADARVAQTEITGERGSAALAGLASEGLAMAGGLMGAGMQDDSEPMKDTKRAVADMPVPVEPSMVDQFNALSTPVKAGIGIVGLGIAGTAFKMLVK